MIVPLPDSSGPSVGWRPDDDQAALQLPAFEIKALAGALRAIGVPIGASGLSFDVAVLELAPNEDPQARLAAVLREIGDLMQPPQLRSIVFITAQTGDMKVSLGAQEYLVQAPENLRDALRVVTPNTAS